MGLRDWVNRLPGVHPAVYKWQEPTAYRIRLRGDFLARLLTALGVWAIATGAMLVIFAFNVHKPGVFLAIFLGAVFGLGPASVFLFFLRGHVSGKVTISHDRPSDSYVADWIGRPASENHRTLSGDGVPVIGLRGRRAAVLDAIDLVLKE